MKQQKQKQPRKKPGKLPSFSFFSIAAIILGAVGLILTNNFVSGEDQSLLRSILMWVCGVVLGVGLICFFIAIAIYRYYDKHPELPQPKAERIVDIPVYQGAAQAEKQNQTTQDATASTQTSDEAIPAPKNAPEAIPDAVAQLDNNVTYVGGNVTYIPSMEAYEFINMGRYQTLDDKFDQISKMDHTQFVIYVARLFSRKGYQVKLTPVVDNYEIDLIVEKMGVTIAVGCLLTNKVLCKEDIEGVRKGKDHYNVNNCMALTNMYFDRTALEYARAEKMSLVDRNIIAEDFMN